MKIIKSVILFICVLFSLHSVYSQTIDEIVTSHINAMGGADKLSSLHTLRMTGHENILGTDVTVVTSKSHLTGMRVDISVMGAENYEIVTPTGGTTFLPFQGMSEPMAMNADQLKALQSQLDVQDPLLNYHDKGTTVELLGGEQVDGENSYKLKLTFSNGHTINYYISARTGYLVKISGNMNINGEDTQIETSFSNYKQNSDGYWFAYTLTNHMSNTDYTNIETNINIDPNIFNH
jgi:hypothetical protein